MFDNLLFWCQDGVYLEPSNSELQKGGGVKKQSGDQYIPELSSSHSGANYFSRRSQILHLVRYTYVGVPG